MVIFFKNSIQFIVNIVTRYKAHVFDVLGVSDNVNEDLNYWRNITFAYAVLIGAPLSLIAIIPGIYYSYLTGITSLPIYDVLAFGLMCFITLSRSASILVKKYLLVGSTFIFSTILILALGVSGPGLLYLYVCVLASLIFFSHNTRWFWSFLGTVICLVTGVVFHLDLGPHSSVPPVNLKQWIAVSSNFIFLSFFTSAMIPHLFIGIERLVNKNKILLEGLNNEQEELERLNTKLSKRNEELEAFVHAASHDLKEPARVIHSFMSLLKAKYSTDLDEKANSYVDHSLKSSKRMMQLVDDLLVYMNLENKNEYENIDLEELITDIVLLNFGDKEIDSVEFIYANLPTIKAAKIPLTILFTNLISNAVKYACPSKTLKVEILFSESDEYWRFAVKDNGIGIDPAYHHSIFDMFYRLHSQKEIEGSGIGLAICKRIVNNHHGTIGLISEPKKGSEFVFTIRKS